MKTALFMIGCLTFTGCTIERTVVQEATTTIAPETTRPPETQPPTTPTPARGDEASYVRELRKVSPPTRSIDESYLLETGWAICDGISNGATLDDLATMIIDSASDEEGREMLQYVTVYAVLYLCPEYDYIMESDF